MTAGKWLFFHTSGGRRREMGLGPFPDVTLKQARGQARKWREVVRQGLDPITERNKERRQAERRMHLLRDVALDAFEARKAELKDDGKAGRWLSPLDLHVLPKLGARPVAEIDQLAVRDTLAPIWHEKADTARKAITRLSIVLRHAAALGLDVDLQATDKAKALLGAQRHKVTHIASLPWREVPAFYESLSEGTTTHLALRLLILTGVRSKPLRFMHESQVEGDVWTIPAELMKSRKDAAEPFRVPLSIEALEILSETTSKDGFFFPAVRKGVISDATMSRLMERRKMDERPHGFRSSLREWIDEATSTPYEVAEMSIAHKVGGSVERAYRRSDYLDQRRIVLQRWAAHVTKKSADVVSIVR
ncbi:integrase arm-type DNA-binding domain-containing protein [Planktotalea sp.]|uniref:tyrosine-type recombinase/integrase n=1 Tax=Planktotalea sp. TaxID=2029877 RepID=UPI0032979A69